MDDQSGRANEKETSKASVPQGDNTPPQIQRPVQYEPLFPVEPAPFPLLQDARQAVEIAGKCLHCDSPAPCVVACPLEIDIPEALRLIEQGQIYKAGQLFTRANPLAELCGRLCPQNLLCQTACNQVRGDDSLQIGQAAEYTAFIVRQQSPAPAHLKPGGPRIAVIGSGPAGLAAAHSLIKLGFRVHVFESMPEPGGMLRYGIPEYKTPPGWIDDYVDKLARTGVIFETSQHIGIDRSIQDLLDSGFVSIFLATGCNIDIVPDIPGVDLPGIYRASDFIALARRKKEPLPAELEALPEIGHRIVVLGGGSTAADCLRAAIHIGAEEVSCIFHLTEAEMPGDEKLRAAARRSGARFRYLTRPLKFIADSRGHVSAMECLQCELGPPDKDGNRKSVPIPGSNFLVRTDTVVLAVGTRPDPMLGRTTPGLDTHTGGLITADRETCATSLQKVYAGGDAVRGPHYLATAVRDGLRAAAAIARDLT